MGITALAFYLFAIVAVGSGLLVVLARNPVHSVLWLILTFFSAAGMFVLMGAEFVAMLLAIVYVGAVAVLFLFVVMMLDVDFTELKGGMAKFLLHLSVSGRRSDPAGRDDRCDCSDPAPPRGYQAPEHPVPDPARSQGRHGAERRQTGAGAMMIVAENTVGLLFIATFSLVACTRLFLTPEDCFISFGGHGGVGSPYKLANGIIAADGGGSNPDDDGRDNFAFIQFQDCASGSYKTVHYSSFRTDYDSNIVRLDKYDPSLIGEFRSRAKVNTGELSEIAVLASEFKYGVTETGAAPEAEQTETCGCRIFYPELRGNKQRYEVKA
jgi:hypothetical protein